MKGLIKKVLFPNRDSSYSSSRTLSSGRSSEPENNIDSLGMLESLNSTKRAEKRSRPTKEGSVLMHLDANAIRTKTTNRKRVIAAAARRKKPDKDKVVKDTLGALDDDSTEGNILMSLSALSLSDENIKARPKGTSQLGSKKNVPKNVPRKLPPLAQGLLSFIPENARPSKNITSTTNDTLAKLDEAPRKPPLEGGLSAFVLEAETKEASLSLETEENENSKSIQGLGGLFMVEESNSMTRGKCQRRSTAVKSNVESNQASPNVFADQDVDMDIWSDGESNVSVSLPAAKESPSTEQQPAAEANESNVVSVVAELLGSPEAATQTKSSTHPPALLSPVVDLPKKRRNTKKTPAKLETEEEVSLSQRLQSIHFTASQGGTSIKDRGRMVDDDDNDSTSQVSVLLVDYIEVKRSSSKPVGTMEAETHGVCAPTSAEDQENVNAISQADDSQVEKGRLPLRPRRARAAPTRFGVYASTPEVLEQMKKRKSKKSRPENERSQKQGSIAAPRKDSAVGRGVRDKGGNNRAKSRSRKGPSAKRPPRRAPTGCVAAESIGSGSDSSDEEPAVSRPASKSSTKRSGSRQIEPSTFPTGSVDDSSVSLRRSNRARAEPGRLGQPVKPETSRLDQEEMELPDALSSEVSDDLRRSNRARAEPDRLGELVQHAEDTVEENTDCRYALPPIFDRKPKKERQLRANLPPAAAMKDNSSKLPVSDDGWSSSEVQRLRQAHRTADPTSGVFWKVVAEQVGSDRSATECRDKWFSLVQTPAARRVKKKPSKKAPPPPTYAVEEDDIFNSTPMRHMLESDQSDKVSKDNACSMDIDIGSAFKVDASFVGRSMSSDHDDDEFGLDFRPKAGYKSYLQNMKRDAQRQAKKGPGRNTTNLTLKAPRTLTEAVYDGDVDMNVRLTPGGTLKVKNSGFEDEDDFWEDMYEGEDEEEIDSFQY